MTDTFSNFERRITVRMLSYWEKLRGDRDMPAHKDINPMQLQDLWDNCFVVEIKDLKAPDYYYAHLGERIAAAYRSGVPQSDASDLIAQLASGYDQIVKTSKPLIHEGEFRNLRNETVRYRQCLLPLGDERGMHAIFGAMRCKTFSFE